MMLSTIRRSLLLAALVLLPAIASAQDTLVVTVVPGDDSHPNPNHYSEVFAIDGVPGKELVLERGRTYVFNTDAVPSLHPLMISPALVSGGAYIDGVTGNESYQGEPPLVFTPSGTAPDTLYYVCWRHSNMGWRIILTGTKTAPDFTVSVATKDNTHPYFGVGFTDGFVVNGVQGKELTVERGTTYRFQMDNVPAEHPFYITTDPVGSGALEYSDGVTGNAATGNAVLEFLPSAFSPDTLYYQCQNHPNMGWRILVKPSLSGGVDDNAANAGILSAIVPNPVRGAADFTLTPPRTGSVRIALVGADGREVAVVHEGMVYSGVQRSFRVETSGIAAGTYRLQVSGAFRVGQNISVAR